MNGASWTTTAWMGLFAACAMLSACAVSAGVREPPPPPVATPTSAELCRLRPGSGPETADQGSGSDALELVVAAVEASKSNDRQCGVPPDLARQCRALAVAMLADPATYLDDPSRLRISIELTTWAAAEGAASAAGPEIARSWKELADLISLLGQEDQEILQAEFLRRRDAEEIVVPLRAAEAKCAGNAGRELAD